MRSILVFVRKKGEGMKGKRSSGPALFARYVGIIAAWCFAWIMMFCVPGTAVAAEEEDAAGSFAGAPIEGEADFASSIKSVEALSKVVMVGEKVQIEVVTEPNSTNVVTKARAYCAEDRLSMNIELHQTGANRFYGEVEIPHDWPWSNMWLIESLSVMDSEGNEGMVWNNSAGAPSYSSIGMPAANFAIENPDSIAPDVTYKTTDFNKGVYSPYVEKTDDVRWLISDESVLQFEGTEAYGPFEEGRYEHLLRYIPRSSGSTAVYCFVNGNLDFVTYVGVTYADPIDIGETTIRRIDAEYEYTGEAICPEPLVSFSPGGTLKAGRDYEVSYENNVEPGTATVVIKAIGNAFTGEKRVDFRIAGQVPELQDFYDVAPGTWYYEPVMYAASRGLVQGYGNSGYYGPDDTLTRAQAAMILCRYFAPEVNLDVYEGNRTGMSDVEGYTWYTSAANWAVSTGVIGGRVYSDGAAYFEPHDIITREELCTMVARAAASFRGADIAGADRSAMLSTNGHEEVSPWADDSVAWCMDNGVVNGVSEPGGRHVRPQGVVTRATMAQVMMNAIEGGVM